MNISAVILTFNEERNIVDCIRTLKSWCSDIVVFDSFSTDNTVALARAEGARIFQRKFDNYAKQRNAALHDVKYPGEWVVMVDADERWNEDIGRSIVAEIAKADNADVDIIHYRRKDMFIGRWLRHNVGYATWYGRVLRLGKVEIQREINEEYHCQGRKLFVSDVRFIHYPFINGMSWWFLRHNRYSDMEAIRLSEERGEKTGHGSLLSRDPVLRRQAQKQLLYRLPCRPLLMFTVLYFFKLGFLDGRAGFHYSVLRSIYEYMIDLKIKELRYLRSGRHF